MGVYLRALTWLQTPLTTIGKNEYCEKDCVNYALSCIERFQHTLYTASELVLAYSCLTKNLHCDFFLYFIVQKIRDLKGN